MLLDTHVLLWLVSDAPRLPSEATRARFEGASRRFVSSASAYEIAHKTRLGRLRGGQSVLDGWSRILRNLRATELSLSIAHMTRAGTLPWDHRDPFDRMLVAQAQLEGIELLTGDAAILGYDGVQAHPWT